MADSTPSTLLPGRKPVPEQLRRHWENRGVRSRLSAARRSRGISQEVMAQRVGLSIATYRRLENGLIPNPGLRYLVNCALVLDVQLTSLFEDEWLEWGYLGPRTPTGPPNKPHDQNANWPEPPPAP